MSEWQPISELKPHTRALFYRPPQGKNKEEIMMGESGRMYPAGDFLIRFDCGGKWSSACYTYFQIPEPPKPKEELKMNINPYSTCKAIGGVARPDGLCYSCGKDGSQCSAVHTSEVIVIDADNRQNTGVITTPSVPGAVRWVKRRGFLNQMPKLILQQQWTHLELHPDKQVPVSEWRDVPIEEKS